ncbi:MAG: aldo/keto reductase [Burkholderiaceae bacterium]|nr:MAG: aldo/keto reductase [Burkholderiaceae bacterium]
MKYRQLGRSGLEVSVVSIGCSGYWGQAAFAEAKAEAVIHEAVERGVNLFDTGHHYCKFNAEPRLGRILEPLLASKGRERFVISSKATDSGAIAGMATHLPAGAAGQRSYSPDYVEASCATSIRNLRCGHLDIFQLHGIREHEFSEPLLDRLLEMKRRGMYRCLGVNTHSESLNRFVARHPDLFGMVLIDYNVLQLDREPVIDELAKAGVGVVAGTVLAQGHLVPGKIGSLRSMSDLWYLARALLKPSSRRLGKGAAAMREVLSSFAGMTAAQAAFAYVLGQPGISSGVFGTTRPANLREIVASAEIRLREEDCEAIRAAFAALPDRISE